MRSILFGLIFIFSVLSLAPNMQGIQLLNLNEMCKHYEKDLKNESLQITNFVDFLNEHYNKIIDLEVDDHKKLPFKSELPVNIELAINQQKLEIVTLFFNIKNKKLKVTNRNQKFSNDEVKGIWNPPRI